MTYTRLGELFLDEDYCDIAIVKFRQALKYARQLNNDNSIARTLKFIGSVYQLTGKVDSALYYFNESLNTSYDLINSLDIEKNIAQILFEKGEKDSAYHIVKNNLSKIHDYGSRFSYYVLLGAFYYHDNKYDSAIYYLKHSFESHYFYTKLYAASMLSSIYSSLQDNEKKAYYDNIISQLSIENINKNTDNAKLQNVYEEYKERKNERDALRYRKKYISFSSHFLSRHVSS